MDNYSTSNLSSQDTRLNLGCGAVAPEGWVNVDGALGARLARIPGLRAANRWLRLFELDWDSSIYIANLSRRLPWADQSVDVVYSSHTLEHLTREAGVRLLQECFRILRPGGIIRVIVPDLANTVEEYNSGYLQANEFIEALGVLVAHSENWLKDRFGRFVSYPHKCMYDQPTLVRVLEKTGYRVRPMRPFESEIHDIRSVELAARTDKAVIVEGIKPTLA